MAKASILFPKDQTESTLKRKKTWLEQAEDSHSKKHKAASHERILLPSKAVPTAGKKSVLQEIQAATLAGREQEQASASKITTEPRT